MRTVAAALFLLAACQTWTPVMDEVAPHLELREELWPRVLEGRATLAADGSAVQLQLDLDHACRDVEVHTLVHLVTSRAALGGRERLTSAPVPDSPELVTTPFDADGGRACRERPAGERLGELVLVTPWHQDVPARVDATGAARFPVAWPAAGDRAALLAPRWYVRTRGGAHAAYLQVAAQG